MNRDVKLHLLCKKWYFSLFLALDAACWPAVTHPVNPTRPPLSALQNYTNSSIPEGIFQPLSV